MDHAGPFGHTGQGYLAAIDLFPQQGGLGTGVGGQDGLGHFGETLGVKPVHQPGQGPGDPLQRQRLADNPGGGGQHQGFLDLQQAGGNPGALPGVRQPRGAGAGVGVAGVHQDGLGLAPPQALPAKEHRSRLDQVGGEDPGRGGGGVCGHQGQIQGAGLLETGGGGGKAESGNNHDSPPRKIYHRATEAQEKKWKHRRDAGATKDS